MVHSSSITKGRPKVRNDRALYIRVRVRVRSMVRVRIRVGYIYIYIVFNWNSEFKELARMLYIKASI